MTMYVKIKTKNRTETVSTKRVSIKENDDKVKISFPDMVRGKELQFPQQGVQYMKKKEGLEIQVLNDNGDLVDSHKFHSKE